MSKILLLVVSFLALTGCVISVGLQVSIRTVPPSTQPYPAAIWIDFACHVDGAIGTVFHNWTAFCSLHSPPQFVDSIDDNEDNHGEFTLRLRSTPPVCLDMIVCTANDSIGQTGNATWLAGSITGAGLWGNSHPILNNSALVADSRGQIGIIHCHSSSFDQDVGRWISPIGSEMDITENHDDKFSIMFVNGPFFPSFNTFQLQDPLTVPFTPDDQGVYSCVVPDNNGVTQTLHIGIYSNGYLGVLEIRSVSLHMSRNPLDLAINCATTGFPATWVLWYKSGRQLEASSTHQMTSVLTNRLTSDYDNLLTINQTINEATGLYVCSVRNAEYEPTNTTGTVSIEEYHIALYAIGNSEQITCTLGNHSNIQWVNENGIPVSNPNQPLNLFSLNDSIHGNDYFCRGYNTSTLNIINDDNVLRFKVLVLIPDSAIQALTTDDNNNPPILGQHYAINCRAVKTTGGLINSPEPQWAHNNGTSVSEGNGVSLNTSANRALVLSFSPLRLSHLGSYQCRATLSSPALNSPLIVSNIFVITTTIPAPELMLFGTLGNIFAGSMVVLYCDATLSTLVDAANVVVQFTWKDANSGRVLSNSSEMALSDVSQPSTLQYRSMLIDSNVSADSAYLCEARIQSENSSQVSHLLHPSTVATTLPFSFNITEAGCTQSVQVKFGEVNNCSYWKLVNTVEKSSNVIMSLVDQINQQCPQCQVTQQTITNTEFICNEGNLKFVTFQAKISGISNCNRSIDILSEWAQSGDAVITVGPNRLKVEQDCNIASEQADQGCSVDKRSFLGIGVGVGSAVGILLVAIVIAVTVLLCFVYYKKRYKDDRFPADITADSKVYANPIPQSRVQFMTPMGSSPPSSPSHHNPARYQSPQEEWLQSASRQGANMPNNRNLKRHAQRTESVDSDGYIEMSSYNNTLNDNTTYYSDHTAAPAVNFDKPKYMNVAHGGTRYEDSYMKRY